MRIQVSSVSEVQTATGRGGKPYKFVDLEYYSAGKKLTRKIIGFSDVFPSLSGAKADQLFEVTVKKNGEFTDWTSATLLDNAVEADTVKQVPVTSGKVATPTRTSTYETPEERAARQELIVRQSSITNAIALYNSFETTDFGIDDVLKTAKEFRDFVYGVGEETLTTPRVE